jgi:hypothetical protein
LATFFAVVVLLKLPLISLKGLLGLLAINWHVNKIKIDIINKTFIR